MLIDIPLEDEAEEAVAAPVVAAAAAARTPLISIEDAKAKIGPEVLAILDEKFKGSLTEVRHPDERDHFF